MTMQPNHNEDDLEIAWVSCGHSFIFEFGQQRWYQRHGVFEES